MKIGIEPIFTKDTIPELPVVELRGGRERSRTAAVRDNSGRHRGTRAHGGDLRAPAVRARAGLRIEH